MCIPTFRQYAPPSCLSVRALAWNERDRGQPIFLQQIVPLSRSYATKLQRSACKMYVFFINFIISLLCFVHSVPSSFIVRCVHPSLGQRSFTEHLVSVLRSLTVRSLSVMCPFFACSAFVYRAFSALRSYIAFALKRNGTGTFYDPRLYNNNSGPKFRHLL